MFHKMLMLVVGLVMAIAVVGCNTVKGVGEDVSAGGKAISNTSEKVSQEL